MRRQTSHFEFKDRILMELKFIAGAFGVIRSLDTEKASDIDLEMFGNGMLWHTEFLYEELEEYFYPQKED